MEFVNDEPGLLAPYAALRARTSLLSTELSHAMSDGKTEFKRVEHSRPPLWAVLVGVLTVFTRETWLALVLALPEVVILSAHKTLALPTLGTAIVVPRGITPRPVSAPPLLTILSHVPQLAAIVAPDPVSRISASAP